MLASASSSRLRSCTRTLACSRKWRCKERYISVATHPVDEPTFFPRRTQSQLYSSNLDSNSRAHASRTGRRTTRYKMELSACADNGHAARAIRICAEMKKAGVKPDLTSYNWVINACARQGLSDVCLALLDDMPALELTPNPETFNHVLYSQRWSKKSPFGILDRMKDAGLTPNVNTYHSMVQRYHEAYNLEMCLQCVAEMNRAGLSPSLKTAQLVIGLATFLGHPRLALDLAHAFESSSVRKLEAEDWIRILGASTACHFEDGVNDAWGKAVDELGVTPDEGQCIEVLHTASRLGLTDLALRTLQVLIALKVPLEEYHLAPVLETFCRRQMVEEAFSIINLMKSSGVHITQETIAPLVACLSGTLEQVDAAWETLMKMHQDGKTVDVVSLDAVIQAAIRMSDLQRAIGCYKSFSDFGVEPQISTFNILLSGCISASHRELGDKLLADLQELGLTPDQQTFDRMIHLCLTQATYEDAFFYLEEMKSKGHMPPPSVYTALVKRCISHGDVRWKIALDEMKECGYALTSELQHLVNSRGILDQ